MSRRVTRWFTVTTSKGVGWYRTREHAFSAARWVARESGETVTVTADASGHRWPVAPGATES